MWKKLKRIFIIWVSKFNWVIFIKKCCNKEDIYNQIARIHWYSFAISQYFSMQMDRRRYWYWIHPRILKYAWKWKSKTCFNTPMVDRTSLQTIIYDAILIALTRRGSPLFSSSHRSLRAPFPSLETSCKPLRRREAQGIFSVRHVLRKCPKGRFPLGGIFLCFVNSRVELIRKDKEKFRSVQKISPGGKQP
jgi:hypothetical protein